MFYRYIIMRLIAMTGLAGFIFPAAVILFVVFGWEGPGRIADYFGYMWAVMLAGFLLPLMITRRLVPAFNAWEKRKAKLHRFIFTVLNFMIPISAAILIFDKEKAYFSALVGIVFFAVGVRGSYREYYEILGQPAIYTGIAVSIVSAAATAGFDRGAAYAGMLLACIYIFIAVTAVILNQNNLDSSIKTSAAGASQQRRLRFYNMVVVVVMLTVAIISVNAGNLAGIVESFINNIAGLPALIIFLLGSLFKGNKPAKIPTEDEGGGIGSLFEQFTQGSRASDIIIAAAFSTAILIIVIYKLKKQWLTGIFAKIINSIRRFFRAINSLMYSFFALEGGENSKYYIDEVTGIRSGGNRGLGGRRRGAGNGGDMSGLWRKLDLGLADRITDPIMKMRYIFAVAVNYMTKRGIEIRDSDTVGDICAKAPEEIRSGGMLDELAGIYAKTRYGEIMPERSETDRASGICREIIIRK